ncbi:MAG: cupin domain-containing protein [Solirubrobacterales bacterium]|nr:cupin domain-containing protein [Solirubrobacterales bacterium]
MAYDKVHRDDFEMNGNWALARKSLGVNSFGINLVTIDAGERIPEHDEIDRDQEEVFIILSGSPALVIDGDEIPVEAGDYVRLDPEHKRTVENIGETPCDVLIVSAPRTSGYEPMGWA